MDVQALLTEKAGIHLDLGCGGNKQPGFVGLDTRALPGVDIVHDLNEYPWPLPDECVIRLMASHLVEHINPANFGFIKFMDEAWRICKPGGEFLIAAPYGYSPGFIQDPTHCNPLNETTMAYFDPLHQSGLWGIYQPKPWYYRYVSFDPIYNIEIVLKKHSADPDKWATERDEWGPVRLGR